MRELHQQVAKFKQWAATAERLSGEWECDYEHWQYLWAAASDAIVAYRDGLIPNDVANDLLYALARDNECEHIRVTLQSFPALVTTLAKLAVVSGDAAAKWQIVTAVAEAQLPNSAELLRRYLSDSDEYVRRRSLMAIAPFSPKEAEAIAITNLKDDFEYTRMAALHVLNIVESDHLQTALDLLTFDPSKYVRQNVEELRAIQKKA
jgi:HEAT repeat protein